MSRSPIGLFWWRPLRSPRLAIAERRNARAWAGLARDSRRTLVNFGDELSPLIVRHVAGRDCVWRPPSRADLIALGSLLEIALRRGAPPLVWGSGLRDGAAPPPAPSQRTSFIAVRGPATRDALKLPAQVALGDPGLLAHRLCRRERSRLGTRRAVLLIPHFSTWPTPRDSGGFDVVAPTQRAADVVARVAGARAVVSSSLHGIVVAHSLGVPAVLLAPQRGSSTETAWKYADHYDSLGAAPVTLEPTELGSSQTLMQRIDEAEAQAPEIEQRAGALGETLSGVLRDALR